MMGVAVYGVIFRKFPLEHAVLAKADAKGADPQFGFRAFQRPERNPFTACGGLHLLRGRRAFAQEAPQEPLGVLSGRAFPVRLGLSQNLAGGAIDSFAPQNARSEYGIFGELNLLEVVDISAFVGADVRLRPDKDAALVPLALAWRRLRGDDAEAGDCREGNGANQPLMRSRPTVPLAR